jgi:glycerol uptake facilitator-like aquaporin
VQPTLLNNALGNGGTYAVLVAGMAAISADAGRVFSVGHFNPAVSFGVYVYQNVAATATTTAKTFSLLYVVVYAAAQCAGGFVGAREFKHTLASVNHYFAFAFAIAIRSKHSLFIPFRSFPYLTLPGALKALLPAAKNAVVLGSYTNGANEQLWSACALEALATALLVAVVAALAVRPTGPSASFAAAAGVAVSVATVAVAPFTGGGLNPARVSRRCRCRCRCRRVAYASHFFQRFCSIIRMITFFSAFCSINNVTSQLKFAHFSPLIPSLHSHITFLLSFPPYTRTSLFSSHSLRTLAQAFGGAAAHGVWHNQWVYWLGALAGAFLGAVFVRFAQFAVKAEDVIESVEGDGDNKGDVIKAAAGEHVTVPSTLDAV